MSRTQYATSIDILGGWNCFDEHGRTSAVFSFKFAARESRNYVRIANCANPAVSHRRAYRNIILEQTQWTSSQFYETAPAAPAAVFGPTKKRTTTRQRKLVEETIKSLERNRRLLSETRHSALPGIKTEFILHLRVPRVK